jgi:hypothetical protein
MVWVCGAHFLAICVPFKAWCYITKVDTHCNVTVYRNTVSWQCVQYSWPHNVSKVGYAVTLWACLVHGRYLAFASKGWYGYSLSRSGRATWHVTTVRSSRLIYIHDASASHNKLGAHGIMLTGYCYAMRHAMKVQIVTPCHVSHLQRYRVPSRRYCECVPTLIRVTNFDLI